MRILFRRPVLLLVLAVIMFLYCILEYNILLPVIFSFFAIGTGNFLESAMSFIQLIFRVIISPEMLTFGLLFLAGALIAASMAAAALFAGLFNIVNNVLDKKPKFKGEFVFGLKKHFLSLFTINLRVGLFSMLLTIFIMIACVPAIAATRAAAQDKPELVMGAAIVDVITFLVVFFCLLFYRSYILFWYPAALKFKRKTFSHGKRFVDSNFWRIAGRIVGYDIAFLLLGGLLLTGKLALMHEMDMNFALMFALLVLDWIFKTVFSGIVIVYIFSFFKKHSEHLKEETS